MKTAVRKRRNLSLVWLLLAVLLICCCCAAGAAALSKPGGGGPGSSGLSAQVCAGFTTTPRFQAGIAWYTLISSYYPPLMVSPYVVCVEVPWSLALSWPSMAGEVVFPP